MKAITFNDFGEADVLQLTEAPSPEVCPTDLLVRVHAAGVNRADLTHRRGGYGRPNFGDSTIMGLEIAGEVIETGSDSNGFKAGDRVMGVVGGGAYAEVARIDYRMAMPIPAALDYVHAAAIPEVFVTAHEAMLHLGRLTHGNSVLIHAAAGGVGSAAMQLAKATGASIFATAEATKLERVSQLGADVTIDSMRAGQPKRTGLKLKRAQPSVMQGCARSDGPTGRGSPVHSSPTSRPLLLERFA
jgi:NADPH2:quinone reductase